MKPLPATGVGIWANGVDTPLFRSTFTIVPSGEKPVNAKPSLMAMPSGSWPVAESKWASAVVFQVGVVAGEAVSWPPLHAADARTKRHESASERVFFMIRSSGSVNRKDR